MKALLLRLVEASGLNALLRRAHRGKIKVLLYHNLASDRTHFPNAITPEQFDAHLRYLKRHYNCVGIDQTGAWQGLRSDRVNVLVTFDDGFRSVIDTALPILRRHRVPVLCFVIAECLKGGAPPAFAKARPDELETYATVRADEVRELVGDGVTIGSHSLRHDDFRDLADEAVVADARHSRAQLEAVTGAPVATFAFPWGYHRPHHRALLGDIYTRVFLTEHGFCTADDRFIPRNEVDTLAHLAAAASGSLDLFKNLISAPGESPAPTSGADTRPSWSY